MHVKISWFFSFQDVAPIEESDELDNTTTVEDYIEKSLDWISIVGCCVSTLSLMAILITYIGER